MSPDKERALHNKDVEKFMLNKTMKETPRDRVLDDDVASLCYSCLVVSENMFSKFHHSSVFSIQNFYITLLLAKGNNSFALINLHRVFHFKFHLLT